MKTYCQYLFVLFCLTIISCNQDELIEFEEEQSNTVLSPCLDPDSSATVSLVLNTEDWMPESLTQQHYLLFRNADMDEIFMPNCNLKSTTKSELYYYECEGDAYEIAYDYQFLQFVSIGGNSASYISSAATLSCDAIYNEQTAEIDRVTRVHLSGGNDEAAYIILNQSLDGTIDLEYGSSLAAVTINNTTFLEVYLNGTSLMDSDIVANAEDGVVAVKNQNDVWYTLVDIN